MNQVVVWSGFAGGAAIGVYLVVQLLLTGKPLGVSTGYGNVCGLVSRCRFFTEGPYEQINNWRLWFLVGLPLGGVIAVLTSGVAWEPTLQMGALYDAVLPSAAWAKSLVLLFGGVLIGYGARSAGGCPSGHSIWGISLFNPPSLLASAGFFIGGIVIVQVMFRVFG